MVSNQNAILLVLNEYQLVYALSSIPKNSVNIWLVQNKRLKEVIMTSNSFRSTDIIIVSDFRSLTSLRKFLKSYSRFSNRLQEIDFNSCLFYTSYTYGFHFAFICKVFNISWEKIRLMDDGLSTLIPINVKNYRFKQLLYYLLGLKHYKPRRHILALDSRVNHVITIFPKTINTMINRDIVIEDVTSAVKKYIYAQNNNFTYLGNDNTKHGVYLVSDRAGYAKINVDKEIFRINEKLKVLARNYGIVFLLKRKYSNPMAESLDVYFENSIIKNTSSIEFLFDEFKITTLVSNLNTTVFLIKRLNLPIHIEVEEGIITKDSHESKVQLFYNCPDFN